MEIKIYKNRPIPPKSTSGRNKKGNKNIYPWSKMEIGDCFAATCTKEAIGSLIRHQQKKTAHRYVRRSIDGKQWVWRIQ